MAAASFMLRGVEVRFGGTQVLREVDLDVVAGERIALVGPSGAGKTTLLRVLNGVVQPTAGHGLMDGTDLSSLRPGELRAWRARVGFVPQDHALVPNLRVVQNVVSGRLGRRGFWSAARSLAFPTRSDLEAAHALLERVGIEEKLYARTDTLSGGQQQRVAIARALFQEPDALLADEPVASVDPARARDLIRLLTELAEERGLTLIASLHDLALAREFFPRVIGLRAGRKVVDGRPASLNEEDVRALYRLEPGHED
ncbi:MAG: phosphonate ABC transporter ATP-binding protein [Planctomycetota bacterium]|nr:phosphonate ABC transporter ATP-binding protein [Planctomycetota bacterium]